ncbi:MAG TPA: DUF2780 domain-containing protein [Nitrospira sp.]
MWKRRWIFPLLVLALLHAGCAQMQSLGGMDALTKLLTSQLGVTSNQATGGVGSMLSLAKERLPGMDFSTLTALIPGADSFMKSARDLGAVTGPVGDQAGLTSAFSRLGMGADMVPKFTGTVSDFVGNAGGEPARKLAAAAFK